MGTENMTPDQARIAEDDAQRAEQRKDQQREARERQARLEKVSALVAELPGVEVGDISRIYLGIKVGGKDYLIVDDGEGEVTVRTPIGDDELFQKTTLDLLPEVLARLV